MQTIGQMLTVGLIFCQPSEQLIPIQKCQGHIAHKTFQNIEEIVFALKANVGGIIEEKRKHN